MTTLKKDQLGRWTVPNLAELDHASGQVILARNFFPEASKEIFFGRGLGTRPVFALGKLTAGVLVVVGASSSKSQQIQTSLAGFLKATPNAHIFQVQGHADHQAIRRGIEAVQRIQAKGVIVIGGGTTLDVGKAIAGLAKQEGGPEIADFQIGKRTINPKKALPWIALPTTSGTGSESTNNAVIELGEEKRSIRNIPPPSMIIADPSFTDSLPLSYTIVSLVDAVAQSLEVITHAKASPEIQSVAVAAFLNLAQGLKALTVDQENALRPEMRDTLSWGSLLMGIAFAHAGLALPHALVHYCKKFHLSHGQMVGILLAPGLQVQAVHNPETALRLARTEQALAAANQGHILSLSFEDKAAQPLSLTFSQLLSWLEDSISKLFEQVSLATSLQQAGLSHTDLEWIAAKEQTLGAAFGIPKQKATTEELMAVLKKAWNRAS